MSDLKTKPTQSSVEEFLATVIDVTRAADAQQVLKLLKKITKLEPVMWGSSIIGFGSYRYKYASGREGETLKMGFSPRKDKLVLYGVIFYDHNTGLLSKLGKFEQGKGCLYIKKLADVNLDVLEEMMKNAWNQPAPAQV